MKLSAQMNVNPTRKMVDVSHEGKSYRVTVLNGVARKIVLPYRRMETLRNGAVHSAYCEREVERGARFDAIAAKV